MSRAYADPDEATEHGACALAILVVKRTTGYKIIERSRKGPGFDYWLGVAATEGELPFQNKARLEVSGIRGGTKSQVAARVALKEKQTSKSDEPGLPAIVVVIEFSEPAAHLVVR